LKAIDGFQCESDGSKSAIDGFRKAIDGFRKAIDGMEVLDLWEFLLNRRGSEGDRSS